MIKHWMTAAIVAALAIGLAGCGREERKSRTPEKAAPTTQPAKMPTTAPAGVELPAEPVAPSPVPVVPPPPAQLPATVPAVGELVESTTAPAETSTGDPADLAAIREMLTKMIVIDARQDVSAAQQMMDINDAQREAMNAFAESYKATVALRQAMVNAYGEEAIAGLMPPMPAATQPTAEEIQAKLSQTVIHVKGDQATVAMQGEGETPATLIRKDGRWLIRLPAEASSPEAAAEMAQGAEMAKKMTEIQKSALAKVGQEGQTPESIMQAIQMEIMMLRMGPGATMPAPGNGEVPEPTTAPSED